MTEPHEDLAQRLTTARAFASERARARPHSKEARTVRQCIEELLDPGSFVEVGTLAHSERPEHRDVTPGDGKVGGHGRMGGRSVTVVGDEPGIKHASTAMVGSVKVQRLYEQAMAAGNPFIYLGQTGGARLPDVLGSEGHSRLDPMAYMSRRRRQIPLVTVIVGQSFGGSSLISALSDFTVQVRGSCLAVTSPLVISEATGEEISYEDLGGVDVHGRQTGQIDLGVETFADAAVAVAHFLSFLPQNRWSPAEVARVDQGVERDEGIRNIVPTNQRQAYDMRAVISRLVDEGDFFEARPDVGGGLLTGLARINGFAVGVVASQPMTLAGAITPKGCDKAVRLLCTCDSFGLPVVFLQDTPGFLVGSEVEHQGMLFKAMLLHQALAMASTPLLTLIIRKSYGLATACLGGMGTGTDTVWAWPDARMGFMDPQVAVRIIQRRELEHLSPEERRREVETRAAAIAEDNSIYGAAGMMRVDEVIDPAETRLRLAIRLDELSGREATDSFLASWPVSW
jgi:acetyl-CoA carboxylase carboxyltransferase component